jgi:hypothetical protein
LSEFRSLEIEFALFIFPGRIFGGEPVPTSPENALGYRCCRSASGTGRAARFRQFSLNWEGL